MKYSEWVAKYATNKYENAMDNFFASFYKWLERTPKAWSMIPANKEELDYRKALDILFANGITEG